MPTAIVTGASRGLGRALADQLVGAGWSLIIDARTPDALHTAAAALRAVNPSVRIDAIPGDITDPSHRSALIAAAHDHGGLNLLINNAGILGPSPLPSIAELDITDVRELLEVNVVGPLALTQLALPLLRASRGTLIDITSDAAVEAYQGWGGYGATKAATEQLRNVLATEETEVTVWRVDPGDMRTEMLALASPGEDISDTPLPEVAAPGLLRLLTEHPPSGRHHLTEPTAQVPPAAPAAPTEQAAPTEPTEPSGPIALWLCQEVDEFASVASFYRDILGLPEIDGWSIDDEQGAVFAVGPAARIEIEQPSAVDHTRISPPNTAETDPIKNHPSVASTGGFRAGRRGAIEYANLDALALAHARVAANGGDPAPIIAHHRDHAGFTVHDPSGVELYLWSEK